MPYNYYDVAQVLGNVIKVVWTQDNIQDMTYRAYPEIDWLKSIHEYKTGKQYSFGITYTPAYGSKFGYTDADGFSLPTPITEGVYQGYVNPRTLVTRRYLTQEAILDTGNDVGALIQLAKDSPQKTAEEHGFHLARNAWTGAAGLMGAIASVSSTTVTLVAGTNMRKFGVNNYIDIKNMTTGASGSTNCDSTYISAVDEDALTITVSAAPTTGGTTTDFGVYLQDETYASGSVIYRASWNSIPELIGTGTVCNIDPSTYVAYKSYVNTATGTLTSKKIQKMINWIKARYKKSGVKLEIWCSPEALDEYGELLIPDVRFSEKSFSNFGTGQVGQQPHFKAGDLGDIPIRVSYLCDTKEMYCFDPSIFRIMGPALMQWWQPEGSIMHRIADKFGIEMLYFSRANMAVINRQGGGKLQAITLT